MVITISMKDGKTTPSRSHQTDGMVNLLKMN